MRGVSMVIGSRVCHRGPVRFVLVSLSVELNVAAIVDAVAEAHPDREALLFRDRRLTWATLAERTSRLANVLHDGGVGIRGTFGEGPRHSSVHDHVALYLHNGNEYLEGMIGSWKARAASFNVNYRYVSEELEYLLTDSAARAVIYHECFAPVLEPVLEGMGNPPGMLLQVADGSGHPVEDSCVGAVDYEEALAAAAPELPGELAGCLSGDDLYLCYTGGTTGMPKGAMWRQEDFLIAALGVRRRDGSAYSSLGELVARARGTVRALPAPPLMHGAAHWNALSAWAAGGTVIIQDHPGHFDAADVLDAAERHAATSLLVVGDPMARPLLEELERTPRELPALRHLLSGGAVLSPTTKERILEHLEGVTIVDVLGSTESGRQAVAQARSGSEPAGEFRPESSAVVLDEALLRVLPPDDPSVGWLAQSGRVPLGYLGDPEKSRRTFPCIDGVRYSVPGDRARWRPDGSVELLGRDSVCINTGGEKVFAEEVETAIKTHPAVLDAVVCGRPSERWGSEVVAIVSLREGAGSGEVADGELRETVGRHLAAYKVPKAIIRVDEVLRAPSGKADYRWARDLAEGAVATP